MTACGISGRGAFSKPRTDQHLYGVYSAGDEVLVRCRVISDGLLAGAVAVEPVGNPCPAQGFRAPLGAITSHTPAPKPLDVGDDVIAPDGNGHGVIRAIVDGKAWVRFAPTILETYKLADLKRLTV